VEAAAPAERVQGRNERLRCYADELFEILRNASLTSFRNSPSASTWLGYLPAWTYVQKLRQRSQEKRFATEMASSGRVMTWREFESAVGNGERTAIAEYLSLKGPSRLWWTPEDIPAISPHNCDRQHHVAFPEPEFAYFFDWCRAQFTNPQSGRTKLVLVPEEERPELKTKLDGARFVSICSFPIDRKQKNSTPDKRRYRKLEIRPEPHVW
jgi:hypothetical protein